MFKFLLILTYASLSLSLWGEDLPMIKGDTLSESPLLLAQENDSKPFDGQEKESKPREKKSNEVQQVTESYEAAFVKTVIVLFSLVALIVLTIWMFRKISYGRMRGMNALKSVKILEKRALSPKSILYLIEVGGKEVLIAESQLEVRKIATLDWLKSDEDL